MFTSICFSDKLNWVWIDNKSYKDLTQEVVPLLELSFKKKIKDLSFSYGDLGWKHFQGDFLWKSDSEAKSYLDRFNTLNKNLGRPLIQMDEIAEKNYRFRLKVEDQQITIPTLAEPEGVENLASFSPNAVYKLYTLDEKQYQWSVSQKRAVVNFGQRTSEIPAIKKCFSALFPRYSVTAVVLGPISWSH